MKLNEAILFSRLRRHYDAVLYGTPSTALHLFPPELYLDHCDRLCADHVYLATVEHLPHRPTIEKGVLLVCISESSRLGYYKERASVILIRKKVDFFGVFQSLQAIYNQFSDWESRLLALFTEAASVQEVLECAYPIFRRPIYLLDEAFHYIASAPTLGQAPGVSRRWKPLELDNFLSFLRSQELSMDKKGFFVMQCEDRAFSCVNLFSSHNTYIGCLYMELEDNNDGQGEALLVEFLAHMVERAMEISPVLMENENSSLAEILLTTMRELPLSRSQKTQLRALHQRGSYLCISIHYLKRFSALPVSYLCATIGALLPGSILFEWNNTLLGVIPWNQGEAAQRSWDGAMAQLVQEMHLCIGISTPFSDLYLLRTFYAQAEAAIENGQLLNADERIHRFSQYALSEMVVNSLGRFPMEAYYPEGFQALLTHDAASDVSYLETLKVYLEENSSLSAASRRLYLHRSTLVERMERIEKELAVDLKDPDQRLQLQILLKALELEQKMKAKSRPPA